MHKKYKILFINICRLQNSYCDIFRAVELCLYNYLGTAFATVMKKIYNNNTYKLVEKDNPY
jgi:hypothetical protein